MNTNQTDGDHLFGCNEIKEKRLKVLKGNYQKPELVELAEDKCLKSECSDMASNGTWQSCCNNGGD